MSESTAAVSKEKFSTGQVIAAWSVHAFTMTGVVWALLSLFYLHQGNIVMMWTWLGVALAVDGLDGTFARKARVKEVVPWFDGVVLDLVVDYLTWTFIPAAFIALYIPAGGGVWQAVMAMLICLSSMFCYCNTGMKSSDNYFVGFPAAWNIVAVAMWLLQTSAPVNIVLIILFSILALVPWKYLHPFRVRYLMPVNIGAVACWFFSTAWWITDVEGAPIIIRAIWWISGLWFVGISAYRTIKGRALRS